jgi:hypothetical protein
MDSRHQWLRHGDNRRDGQNPFTEPKSPTLRLRYPALAIFAVWGSIVNLAITEPSGLAKLKAMGPSGVAATSVTFQV